MRTKYEIELINARLDQVERDIRFLEKKTKALLFKDSGHFDGRGDYFMGSEMGWKLVDVNDLVVLILDHLKLKYTPDSTVPASVVKKSK